MSYYDDHDDDHALNAYDIGIRYPSTLMGLVTACARFEHFAKRKIPPPTWQLISNSKYSYVRCELPEFYAIPLHYMWDESVTPLKPTQFTLTQNKSFTIDYLIREGAFATTICDVLNNCGSITDVFNIHIKSNYYFKSHNLIDKKNGVFSYTTSCNPTKMCDTVNECWWDEYEHDGIVVKLFIDKIYIPTIGELTYTPAGYDSIHTGGLIHIPIIDNDTLLATIYIPLCPRTANHTTVSYYDTETIRRKASHVADEPLVVRITRMCNTARTHTFQQFVMDTMRDTTILPWPDAHSHDFNWHGAELDVC